LSRIVCFGGGLGKSEGRDERVGVDGTLFRQRESNYSSLFMQLVLSSFQILESISKDE